MERKALVVGGNSGIGLSLVCELLKQGFDKVYIVGKDPVNKKDVPEDCIALLDLKASFNRINFIEEDYSIFDKIQDIDTLIISAGFGRVSLFEDLKDAEIAGLLKVNFDSAVRIIKKYYERIKSNADFYTAVMVSISGRIVSPFFSVYGAAKGGLRFFIENINAELSSSGFSNRILDVSPGSLKGTRFNGKENNLSLLSGLSNEILSKMFNREILFIPDYENTYKRVLDDYHKNPELFGKNSYQYKLTSGRISNKPQLVIGYLSGTFDLFHIGHLNLLRRAKEQCDYLIVSVHNSGAWKGKETFIPYDERRAIVGSIKYVDEVADDFAEDSDAWDVYHYDRLFVGSDYKGTERFNRYERILEGKAQIVYFPYTTGTSSSQLRAALKDNKK